MTFKNRRRIRGRARQHTPGRMNKTESAYAQTVLDPRLAAGEIVAYWFESHKLRLADNTWYTPDFMVQLESGEIEYHEIKGHWEDDARVKIKVVASLYPFRFVAIQRKKGEWIIEEISGK